MNELILKLRAAAWHPNKSLLQSIRDARAARIRKKNQRIDDSRRMAERMTRVQFGAPIEMTTEPTPEIAFALELARREEYSELERAA